MKEDLRISAKEDIVSKCGDINNQKECTFYKRSTYRQGIGDCYYSRFKLICDRLIINKED